MNNSEIRIAIEQATKYLQEMDEALASIQSQTEKVAYLMLKFGVKWHEVAVALATYDELLQKQKDNKE